MYRGYYEEAIYGPGYFCEKIYLNGCISMGT